ncbi:protein Star-like [Daphnia pulicaria]|uniref:protein Star-like n=1 Tax=Daphnia pulicaria TaxID=35523 RepID=UPI001EEC9FE0|nr:protein Star-like [Daphnia pulicaria]
MRAGHCLSSPFRCKSLQHFSVCFVILVMSISLVLIYKRSVGHGYDEFSQREKRTNLNARMPARFFNNNRNKYNLMDETSGSGGLGKLKQFFNIYDKACTLDYINANKLAQDHPCVIEIIRKHYLNEPSPPNAPLKLGSKDLNDRSPGQTGVIFRLLKNQTNGFFVECGALDGEYLSNTIDLERKFNWSGVLIEANPKVFESLLSRNRKSWTLPICLSLEPFPTQVKFQPKQNTGLSHIEGEAKTLQQPGVPGVDPDLVTVQCFPFYSVLLAVGRTQIDFFSLDVEGHELKILKTIPWHKVDIKTLTVEWDNLLEGQEALSSFMEESGFIRIGAFDFQYTRDVIFIKDLLNNT